jgi:hypothetical protein
MARYKEVWENPLESTVLRYRDTDAAPAFRFIEVDSEEITDWIALGNTPDPAYTAEEIAAAQAAETAAQAKAYVLETDPHIAAYTERKAAKLAGKINTLKYKSLQRKRAVALGRV